MKSGHSQQKKNKVTEKKILPVQNSKVIFPLLGILLITFFVYARSLKNGFTNYDDDVLILNNSLVHSLSFSNLKLIFISFANGMYNPLVTLSWALEYVLIGNKAMHFHFINLTFHLLNTWLVYRFILLLSKKINIAVIVALFFAIHPMISESVLWLSERKDLLCVAFILGGLIHYLKYLNNNFRLKYLILTLIFFLLALFSKPLAIVFPLLLLVIDYYTGRRIDKKVIMEKFPFFVLSLSFGLIAIIAARSVEGINTLNDYSVADRILFVVYAIGFYIFKMFIPVHFSAKHLYPLKDGVFLPVEYYISIIAVVALIFFIFKLKKQRREILSGMFFYLICISIVLPIVPVGDSVVSERYSYLSYIGLFLIIGNVYEQYKDKLINRSIKLKTFLNLVIITFVLISLALRLS